MKFRTIGFFIFCLVIGFLLISQARLTNGQHLFVSAKTITDYETTIKTETEDMERISRLIEDTEKKLAEYEALADSSDEELKARLLEELEYYKLASGKTEVRGEGVIVVVDDGTRPLYEGEDPNTILVHDMDILTIINDLSRSGAEVLAVNKQRLQNESSISCSGYTIRINDQFFARPFEIRAIGDSKRMAAALIGPDGYATLLHEYGVICKVTISDDVAIQAYPENQVYQYLTEAKEE